jgi:hypothetical protein
LPLREDAGTGYEAVLTTMTGPKVRNWRASLADDAPLLYPAFILAVVVFVAWLMMLFR